MAKTPMTRSNYGELLYKGLHKIFFDDYAKPTAEYPVVFKTETHDEFSKRVGRMMGLGPFRPKDEGGFISMDAGKWLSEKTIYFPTWALGFAATWELMEDDQYGQIEKFTSMLGDAANTTKELLSFDVLNNATSTDDLGLDGLPLLSDSHVTGDGVSTISNLSATALSQVAIEEALIHFDKMLNERSEPRPFNGGKLLIIPPELKPLAKELLLSELKPQFDNTTASTTESSNAINILKDEDIEYFVCHWLTKPDCWFMIDKMNHDLAGITRRPVSFDNTKDPKSTDELYYSTFRYKASFFDWRGVYGFPGT